MKSHKVKEKFMELRAQGLSYSKISKALNVSKPTLIEWGKNFASEIEKLKEIELDAFHERYSIYKRHKIELFSEQLLKIREELAQRDLSDVPTPDLLNIFLEFCDALQSEIDPEDAQDGKILEIKDIAERWDSIMSQSASEQRSEG